VLLPILGSFVPTIHFLQTAELPSAPPRSSACTLWNQLDLDADWLVRDLLATHEMLSAVASPFVVQQRVHAVCSYKQKKQGDKESRASHAKENPNSRLVGESFFYTIFSSTAHIYRYINWMTATIHVNLLYNKNEKI
jgi:hypothetical protein